MLSLLVQPSAQRLCFFAGLSGVVSHPGAQRHRAGPRGGPCYPSESLRLRGRTWQGRLTEMCSFLMGVN